MSRTETNKRLEELVEKAGVPKTILDQSNRYFAEDEWTEEREALAEELLSKDKSSIPEFWQGII